MNILYLAHRLPYPPNKGEKIRTFHQIKQLAKKHTIHLCAFVDDPDDLLHAAALKKYCGSVDVVSRGRSAGAYYRAAVGILRGLPLSVSLFYRSALAKKVLRVMAEKRFDCIIVSCSSMAQYVASSSYIPKVIDFIDVDSEKWRLYARHRSFPVSFIYSREAERLASYEERIAALFDHSLLCSKQETESLSRQAEPLVSVIGNGVDLEYFSPSPISVRPNERTVVFTGAMDYFPNIDAVQFFWREVFPQVRSEFPFTQFYVVGRNPTSQVRQLGKQPNVIVTGAVPDVRPYLAQASVAVAPFRLARGVQNKVLEAMAMGIPVVGTREALKGIAATEQDGVRIAGDSLSFAQHVISFLQEDLTLRRQAGRQARAYVERHHRWEDRGAELEQLIEDVVRRHRQKENGIHRGDAEYVE